MYKVCIADDEPYIRKGIAKRIEQSGLPFLLVGMAQTGDEAWDLYCREKPDLFFLDIRMPGTYGLDVIERVRKEDPDSCTKFIIISGYDDFSYMQKAIQVEVNDYVKKPIQPEEFQHTLQSVYDRMEAETLALSKKRVKGRMVLWNDFYEVQKKEKLSGTFLMFCRKDMMDPEKIWSLTQHFPTEEWKYLWFYSTNHAVLLYSSQVLEEEEILRRISVEKEKGASVIAYSGGDYPDRILYRLEREINRRFYPLMPEFILCRENIDPGKEWKFQEMELALENTQEAVYRKLVEDAFGEQFRKTENYRNITDLYRTILTLLANVYARQGLVLPNDISRGMQPMFLANYEGKDQIVEAVLSMAGQLNDKLKEAKEKSEIVENIIRYMKLHYREELTLTSLANEFFLAPTYLSRKFKNATNQTVMQFLEEYRIERAEELLRQSELPITEIANRVGYNDPNYFARAFKKIKGVTPKEYRKDR